MLSSKTRDLKVRKSFKSIEKRRLIDKFTFFSALNNSNSNKSEVLFNYVKLNKSKNIKSRSRTRFSRDGLSESPPGPLVGAEPDGLRPARRLSEAVATACA